MGSMKSKKLTKYKPYSVKFYDHYIGGDHEIVCQILGYFYSETKNYYTFTHWLVVDSDCETTIETNIEKTSLLKNAIIEIKSLD